MTRNAEDNIDEFLVRGGDALFLIDPVQVAQGETEGQIVGDFNIWSNSMYLEIFGIQGGNDLVFDLRSNEPIPFNVPNRLGQVMLPYPYWVRPTKSDSPESRQVSGDVSPPVLPWASSIHVGESFDDTAEVEVTPLLETTVFGGVDTIYDDLSPQSPRLTQATDADLGPTQVAVAITGTRCPPLEPRCTKDMDAPFRFIVATDSDFLNDTVVNRYPENLDLVMNWIDWLSQEDSLASIRSKGVTIRYLLFNSDTHRNIVQYGNIFGVPIGIAILGILRFFLRRNKTRKVYAFER